ncbi:MAG: hypothetical protein GTO55_11025 [Armatimonadetes bacterium]|nr:hypothetical protein [Armatimonadota bacterium]NIT32140.1 hypothetical protein [Armatimonadota bacterium]
MSDIALGYGSKWHLLRYLGYHRDRLNEEVQGGTGVIVERWLDFPYDKSRKLLDGEWKGLDFLPEHEPARNAWNDFWPQTGNVPNWDAVGVAQNDKQTEWLLVEAKAHIGELHSECKAKDPASKEQIRKALAEAKGAFGVCPSANWLSPYYQYCNRLAVLHFLAKHDIAARLLFIYFTGDSNPSADCPRDKAGWQAALQELYSEIGLTNESPLKRQVHSILLSIESDL